MKLIESITIRYFRSVYTITIPKCGDMTVLTGKNDVGKSNILKALNLFFNQQSDYSTRFSFENDYSLLRREEVRKDTIRGQRFISITIRFNRGERMPNSLPPSFSVTRRWDMHSQQYKQTTDAVARMKVFAEKYGMKFSEKTTVTNLSSFLNKIRFVYIPAIKDASVFNGSVNILQESLFDKKYKAILDGPISEANETVKGIVQELQNDFYMATGIANFVELPNTLNFARGLIQINTETNGGRIPIDMRGDGIRTHYIPKILNYVAQRSNHLYIWGFEEPENSYEYRRCIQVAEEFENTYSKHSQVFITSHSPAFFNNSNEEKAVIHVGYENNRTIIIDNVHDLDEELGYIELYREFLERVKDLEKENSLHRREKAKLLEEIEANSTPVLLTEGKTDAALLKIAIQKLGLTEFSNWDIRHIQSGKTSGNDILLQFLNEIKDNINPSKLVIGMFDRDTMLLVRKEPKSIDLRSVDFERLCDNVYAFCIPVPHNRQEANEISIEHYFTDREIKTEKDGKRLFIGNEFYSTGAFKGDEEWYYKGAHAVCNTIKIVEHETKKYVCRKDGGGDYSISKAAFVKCIEEDEEGFRDISFEEFRKIFDVLTKIHDDAETRKLDN